MSKFVCLTDTVFVNLDLVQTFEIKGKEVITKMVTFDNVTTFKTEEKAKEFIEYILKGSHDEH